MSRFRDPQIWHCFEDAGALLLARVVDWDGDLLTQAAVTSIAYNVFDVDNGNAQVQSGSLVKTTVVYDTEQTGGNWPYSDGYNFRWMMPATHLPTGGHRYVVEIMVTPASGEAFPVGPYHLHAHNRLAG